MQKNRGEKISYTVSLTSGCVAEHSILILKGHHFEFCKKRFAATRAQIIGNVGKNRCSAESGVWRLSICRNMVLAPIGVALYGV